MKRGILALCIEWVESTRIGELGEHKINIQLDQLPRECKSLSDLLIPNNKSRTGFSQIDHVVISPYCLFVIETKNYNGEIKGKRTDQQWSVSNRFKMYNPLKQKLTRLKLENSEPSLSPEQIDAIYDRLLKSNITDQAIRNQHVHRILTNTKGNKGNRT
ncbi:nuclease-related domain-containing protein [Paenibacillus antibioticophila]|uniref:nuclease-related domain-containing protein n=1 Tax=Paenibacillus antibioticophila TaxID=1274374 RepID=UPI000677E035|nr:nuclease-related domain-containing protein [Paenibacillus antibioticophila]